MARLCLRASSFDCSAAICAVRACSVASALNALVSSPSQTSGAQDCYLNARLRKKHSKGAFDRVDMVDGEVLDLNRESLRSYKGRGHVPAMLIRVLTPLL
jgi:hypothetical protein